MPSRHTASISSIVLLLFACFAVFTQSGCVTKLPPPAWEADARALLNQAEGQFNAKLYDLASKSIDTFLYKYPTSTQRDRALYLSGEIRFALRDYRKAIAVYKEVIQEYPSSSYITAAKFRLGQCYFELKEYDLAIANLEDRRKITDKAQLKRISDMLRVAYEATKNYPLAIKELSFLAETAESDQRKVAYRDRIRELVDKNLTEDELKALAEGTGYPSDIALLRLSALLVEQRQYRGAVRTAKEFLERYPNHPGKTRAEMLLNEAMTGLSAPRYILGALLPQSGQLAFFGDRVLKGIQLAVNSYNLQNPEDRVSLLVKDTEGSPEKAAAALTELSSQGIVAVIGPLLTKEAEAIAPELAKVKVPVITPAASGEAVGKLSPWLFRNALTNASQAAAAAQFALDQKVAKYVVIYPDDAYGKDLARLFTRELNHKAENLTAVAYPPEVKDFGPYIRKVIEIDLRSRKIAIPEDDAERKKLFQEYIPGFDTLYLPGYAERIGLLIPQLAFYNITGITLIGSNNWHSPDLIERARRHAEGAVFVDGFFPESPDPAVKAVIDAYRSAYQEEPDILAAQAYDAAAMVLSLVKAHKDTPQAVEEGLLSLRDFPGISGSTTFPGTGEAKKNLFLIKIQDGKFVLYPGEKQ